MEKKRAISYIRNPLGHTTQEAKETLRKVAVKHKWKLIDCYVEPGLFKYCPTLSRAVASIENGEADVLVVKSCNAISQNPSMFEHICKRISKAGGTVWFENTGESTEGDGIERLKARTSLVWELKRKAAADAISEETRESVNAFRNQLHEHIDKSGMPRDDSETMTISVGGRELVLPVQPKTYAALVEMLNYIN